MKIPFDIKYRPQIESGEYKVETRDGKPVRIICWDRKYGYPICGLAYEKETGCENYVNAYKNGMTAINGIQEMNDDLFIITPEPFEQALETFLMNADSSEQTFHENVKKYADKLLGLAKKEVLKDLPMWRKWESGACGNGRGIPIAIVKRWLNGYELVDALGIQGEQYIMISDLEKLPGFNE